MKGVSKRFRRRRTKKRGHTKKVATVSMVKRLIGHQQEHKYFLTSGAVGADFNGTVIPLTDVTQGDTDTSRDGDQLMPQSLELRCFLTVGDTNNVFRITIFRWNDLISGNPAVNSIINTVGSNFITVASFAHDDRQSYTVLFDKTYVLSNTYQVVIQKKFLKLASKSINYIAGSATNGANRIFMIISSDSGAVPNPSITYYTKFNFTDS